MLPQTRRLKKTTEISKVFKNGKFFKESFLILKTLKNNSDKSRFAFIVSRKVSKKATVRNKIKRRLRAIVSKELKEIKAGTDNLIMALPGMESKKFSDTKELLNNLFKKARLFNE